MNDNKEGTVFRTVTCCFVLLQLLFIFIYFILIDMKINYTTQGTCSKLMQNKVEWYSAGGTFIGGCNGNLQAISTSIKRNAGRSSDQSSGDPSGGHPTSVS